MCVFCILLDCIVLHVSKQGMGLEQGQHQQRLEFLLVLVPLPGTCDMQDYNYQQNNRKNVLVDVTLADSFWSPMFLRVSKFVFFGLNFDRKKPRRMGNSEVL